MTDQVSVSGMLTVLDRDDRKALRGMTPEGGYSISHTSLMAYCQSMGMFSRLEECGERGRADVTDFGRRVLAAVGNKVFSIQAEGSS